MLLYRTLRPLIPLAAYAGEASSLSRAYNTTCSHVIARPSAQAASKPGSPNSSADPAELSTALKDDSFRGRGQEEKSPPTGHRRMVGIPKRNHYHR